VAREIDAYGARARLRRPLGIVGLTLLTLGVYGIVWYRRVNVELRDYGRAYRDDRLARSRPRRSVLAIIPGLLLVVPPIVSLIRFVGRVRRAQRYGRSELTSGWLVAVLALALVFLPAITGYVQSTLNELWRRYAAASSSPATDTVSEAELAAAPAPQPGAAVA